MTTYGELLRRCRKDLNKDILRTREIIEISKKELTKCLLVGKNYLKQLGGEMVRPAIFYKNRVTEHHDTLAQYLEMIEYMTDNFNEPIPEIEYICPKIERGYSTSAVIREHVIEISVLMGGVPTIMFEVDLANVFNKKHSIIRRTGLMTFGGGKTTTPSLDRTFVTKLAILYQLGTYFKSLRNIKVINFLRSLKGRKIIINGNSETTFVASQVYASKVSPAKRKQKKPDYLVKFDAGEFVTTVAIRRSWSYFTDKNKYHLWAAMPGRKDFKHIASLVDEMLPWLVGKKHA